MGEEQYIRATFEYDVTGVHDALSAMELPGDALAHGAQQVLEIQHPGGVGEILLVADGGSWAGGRIVSQMRDHERDASEVAFVAIA